jgi:glycosyltransferase involved in cell wall biosynthesis
MHRPVVALKKLPSKTIGLGVSVVIPAYNEEEGLPAVVQATLQTLPEMVADYEVIIVDDASTDRTLEIARGLAQTDSHVRALQSARNVGAAGAQLVGMRQARCDLIFFIPADMQIHPAQLRVCLPALARADFICTVRRPRRDPLRRRAMALLYNLALRQIFGVPVHDVDSVILVRRQVIEAVADDLPEEGQFISAELLVRAVAYGFRVDEVTIEHRPRVTGQSTGMTGKVAARAIVDFALSVRRLRRLLREIHDRRQRQA